MRLDYDQLRKIYRLEKNSSRLAEVDEDFFDSLQDFFDVQKKEYLHSLNDLSSSKAKSFSNLRKIVGEIFSMREKKLLNKALIASRTGEFENEQMALQEAETLKQLLAVLNKHQRLLDQIFKVQSKPSMAKAKPIGKVSLKVLQNVPAFMGADMREYGPFKMDERVDVSKKIGELLVSRKLAEKA